MLMCIAFTFFRLNILTGFLPFEYPLGVKPLCAQDIQTRSQKILLGGSFEGNVALFLLQPFS